MNPITRKSVSELVMQPRFRAVGQKHAEWQTFEKPENKCMAVSPPKPYRHTFASNLQVFQMSAIQHVFGQQLELGCITNLNMLFLVMGSFF